MGLIDDSKRINEIDAQEERAILVGLITPQQGEAKAKEYLDELEFLAETAGAKTVKRFTQRLGGLNSVTYLGIGKRRHRAHFSAAVRRPQQHVLRRQGQTRGNCRFCREQRHQPCHL